MVDNPASCPPGRLQAYAAASQDVMQINLISFSQSELRVDLRPRPCSTLSSNELEPLRLLVTWSSEDRFMLQVTHLSAEEAEGISRRF